MQKKLNLAVLAMCCVPAAYAQTDSLSMNTISTEPQPLSTTARGGNMIDKITLNKDIDSFFRVFNLLHAYNYIPECSQRYNTILYSYLNNSTKTMLTQPYFRTKKN